MLCNSLDIKAAKLFKFVTYIHFNMNICLSHIAVEEKQFHFVLIGAETLCALSFFL